MKTWKIGIVAGILYIVSVFIDNKLASDIFFYSALGLYFTFLFVSIAEMVWSLKESEKEIREFEEKSRRWEIEAIVREEVASRLDYLTRKIELEVKNEVSRAIK